jgi:hypothetical protein
VLLVRMLLPVILKVLYVAIASLSMCGPDGRGAPPYGSSRRGNSELFAGN